jgi:hypothetical protein
VQHKKEKERRDEEGEGVEEGWRKRRGWRPKEQRVREMRANMFCDEDDLRWEKETKIVEFVTCEDDSLAVFAAVAVAVCVMVGLAVELVLEDEM